jgi:polyhydroxyalkanoate synthesis regulator phasin
MTVENPKIFGRYIMKKCTILFLITIIYFIVAAPISPYAAWVQSRTEGSSTASQTGPGQLGNVGSRIAQTQPGPASSLPGDTTSAANIQRQIEAAMGELTVASEDMTALMNELEALWREQPTLPKGADDKARVAYDRQLNEWQRKMDALNIKRAEKAGRVNHLRARMRELQEQLKSKQQPSHPPTGQK